LRYLASNEEVVMKQDENHFLMANIHKESEGGKDLGGKKLNWNIFSKHWMKKGQLLHFN
jgi:hypothetical protein